MAKTWKKENFPNVVNNKIKKKKLFTNSCSENELSYYWSIDGPDSAAENNMVWNDKQITVPFTTAGTYYITLDSYSEFSFLGDKATSSATFIVN